MGDEGARVLCEVADNFQSFKKASEISVYATVAIVPKFGGVSKARYTDVSIFFALL
jgi:hypothetical protein